MEERPTTKDKSAVNTGLYLDADTFALLEMMMEQDMRNRSNMIAFLVRQEAERRGLKLPAES